MTRSGPTMLVTLALVTGLVFQPHPARTLAAADGTLCPPATAVLADRQHGHAVTCRGWSAPDFIAGTAAADVLVQPAAPDAGAPCETVHYHRVVFVGEPIASSAIFTFAGDVSTGFIPLTADQASMAAVADAYVTDVQLGSEEPAERAGALACSLDPTYHFLCPVLGAVDRFCMSWVLRSRPGVAG